jgi:hypothetical protein
MRRLRGGLPHVRQYGATHHADRLSCVNTPLRARLRRASHELRTL